MSTLSETFNSSSGKGRTTASRGSRKPKTVDRPGSTRSVVRDWLTAMGPTLLIVLVSATVVREALLGSITSLSGSGMWLVLMIFVVFFFGIALVAMALWRYTFEARVLARWQSGAAAAQGVSLERLRSQSFAKPLYEAIESDDPADAGARQARLDRELDDVRERLAEPQSFPNFVVGALVGLGLFGTFVGLIGTLEDLAKLFQALMSTGDRNANPIDVFADMVKKLQDPMRSMSTAFVTSLYGLGGSLVLGLAVLMAGKASGRLVEHFGEAIRVHELAFPRAPVVMPAGPDHETLQLELRLRAEQWRAVLDDMHALHERHARETASLREGISDVAQATHGLALAMRERMRVEDIRAERARRGGTLAKDMRLRDLDLERRLNRSKTAIDGWDNEKELENGSPVVARSDLAHTLTRLSLVAVEQHESLRAISTSLNHVEQLLGHAMKRQLSVTLTVDPTRDGVSAPADRSSA
jgi:biopolymer transport protein ExbB/TolQ